MIRSPFLWKLYAGYAALILISVATIGFLVTRQVTDYSMEEIRADLGGKALFLQDMSWAALRSGRPGDLQGRVQRVAQGNPERLTVIRADGIVLADSQRDPATMDNHGSRDEVQQAAKQGSGQAMRYSQTLGARLMYHASAVREDERLLGFVRTSFPLTQIDARLSSLRGRMAVGGVAAVLLGLLIGLFVARRFTRPLTSMTEAAQALAAGDYTRRVEAGTEDEVGTLARSFNTMAGALRERMETITEDRNKVLAILRSMVEGVVAVDRDERVVQINSIAAQILGASVPDGVGRRIWETTRVQEVSAILEQTLKTGEDQRGELRIPVGRTDQTVELRSSPLRDADGQTVGAVLLLHDVTEQRRLETMRRDFVANVSHELKTPLTAIRGLVETLIEDDEMPSDVRSRFLGKVNTQANRLTALVTDLLSLSRLESQDDERERLHLDLRDVVAESFRRQQGQIDEKGLTAREDVGDERLTVLGDAGALGQLVDNLLQNAVRYTDAGGSVLLRTFRQDDTAILEVTDTGIGIEPIHHARLFERFYRVDTARSREMGGTGLGLAIVKHIAQGHRGDVGLDSAPGRGTTFRVRLPITEV